MKNLLIVDDQTGIRMLLEEVFRREGLTTRIAANGFRALQEIEKELPDCILLDMNMPGLDGIEVLERLSNNGVSIPIIMMTAYGDSFLIDQAKALGVKNFFTKPFDIYEVRDAVNKILNN